MVAALQEQLIAAPLQGFPDLFPVGIHGGDISFCVSGDPVEITELAVGDAHIGGVDVPVDLPTHFSMGHLLFPEFICYVHEIGQGGFLE